MEGIEISGLDYIPIELGLVLGNRLTLWLGHKSCLLAHLIFPLYSCTTTSAAASSPTTPEIPTPVGPSIEFLSWS